MKQCAEGGVRDSAANDVEQGDLDCYTSPFGSRLENMDVLIFLRMRSGELNQCREMTNLAKFQHSK